MATGYEKIYEGLLPQLASCCLSEAADRLGLCYNCDNSITLTFLGRPYQISHSEVKALDGNPSSAIMRCVLIYYTISKGSGEPKFAYAPLFRLSGLHEGQYTTDRNLMNKRLTNTFGANYAAFKEAAIRIGGQLDENAKGCHSWVFALFPKIYAKVDFYEADDEFPADVQVFIDEVAIRFMDFECIAFLSGCLVQALAGEEISESDQKELNTLSHCSFIQKML